MHSLAGFGLSVLVVVVAAAGCHGQAAMSATDLLVSPPLGSTYLRYEVKSPARTWTREFVLGRGSFTELRGTGDRAYALGLIGGRAWMRIGSREPVEIDGALAADERTRAAWIGLRYGHPERGDHLELETTCSSQQCTFIYTPRDGHALWVDVDKTTHRPILFAWIANDTSIESCDAITWSDVGGVPVIASTNCSSIVDKVGLETSTWTLVERRDEPASTGWAHVDPRELVPLPVALDAARFPIADPSTRVYVPVDAGGARLQLVLDTGSSTTVLARRAVTGAGVVWSSDPSGTWEGPWIPRATYDRAIVDRLVIGGVELRGISVLVTREGQRDMFHSSEGTSFDSEQGILGWDVLSRFVVDVDGPASTLRLWPHGRFRERGFTDLHYFGASRGHVVIDGKVDEIGPLPVLLDTGAPLDVVVTGPLMHLKHPHHRDEGVALSEGSAGDYRSDVEGFHFGPFKLSRVPAIGHERMPHMQFFDDGGVLVGLGVMRHFRIAIDAEQAVVHIEPGLSYVVLERLGIEIDDRNGVATITRIVGGEHDWEKPLREGDLVKSVDGKKVTNRIEALAAIAHAAGRVRLVVERAGNQLERVLAMEPRI